MHLSEAYGFMAKYTTNIKNALLELQAQSTFATRHRKLSLSELHKHFLPASKDLTSLNMKTIP